LRKDGQGHSHLSINGIEDMIEVSRRHLPGVRAMLKH
jgi:hypothetical protein